MTNLLSQLLNGGALGPTLGQALNGNNATDIASAEAMAYQDQATANIIRRQAIQNVQSAEADAAIANAAQVGQTLGRASSI